MWQGLWIRRAGQRSLVQPAPTCGERLWLVASGFPEAFQGLLGMSPGTAVVKPHSPSTHPLLWSTERCQWVLPPSVPRFRTRSPPPSSWGPSLQPLASSLPIKQRANLFSSCSSPGEEEKNTQKGNFVKGRNISMLGEASVHTVIVVSQSPCPAPAYTACCCCSSWGARVDAASPAGTLAHSQHPGQVRVSLQAPRVFCHTFFGAMCDKCIRL